MTTNVLERVEIVKLRELFMIINNTYLTLGSPVRFKPKALLRTLMQETILTHITLFSLINRRTNQLLQCNPIFYQLYR